MTPGQKAARKLHNRKAWLFLAGIAVSALCFAIAQMIWGNKGEFGAIAFLGFILYAIWVGNRWRPICPNCRTSRASFYLAEHYAERLKCENCGFDESTGFRCPPDLDVAS
jgi:hypothetical protein